MIRILLILTLSFGISCSMDFALQMNDGKYKKQLDVPKQSSTSKQTNDWENMIKKSDVVIVGILEDTSLVIDEKKRKKAIEESYDEKTGQGHLVSSKEYSLGTLNKIQIKEILYKSKKMSFDNFDKTINVYVKDEEFGMSPVKTRPNFVVNKRHLIFLKKVEKNVDLDRASVLTTTLESEKVTPFDYEITFEVIIEPIGEIELNESNEFYIEEIRQRVLILNKN